MARSASKTKKGVKKGERGKEIMGDPTEVIARISEIEARIENKMRGKRMLRRLGGFRKAEEGLRGEEVKKLPKAAEIASILAESLKSVRSLDGWGEREA
ncbi:hypothetical protein GF415_02350 [Candidatus Micrarchaeota archaeon]|nr:hypothetical protein [Candidatus Micrarchaeota archaeon]